MNTLSVYLDKEIEDLLNRQINKENEASFTYLQMATWAEVNGYPGTATFLYEQSKEENEHMLKLIRYLTELEIQPKMPVCRTIDINYGSLQSLFEVVLQHEMGVTKSIHELVNQCLVKKDFATFQFLQWFVEEQRKEEVTVRKIMDFFVAIEPKGMGLHMIDQKLLHYHETIKG